MALGVMEDFSYQSKIVTLGKNDSLLLYTDGVTEAMNENHELFSEKRLEEVLIRSREPSVKELIQDIMKKVLEYCHDSEQTDDITLLAIRFNGN